MNVFQNAVKVFQSRINAFAGTNLSEIILKPTFTQIAQLKW